jgi:uncharacterized protein YdeI (YjbR/CyaY-like superfamily)
MGKKDPRIDVYIAGSADFAKPILSHVRKLVHAACPEVEETLKWNFPHFTHQGILCGMAAFKAHCALGFWKGSLIFPKEKPRAEAEESAMGQFGRITSLSDLPSDRVFIGYIREAVRLNEAGIKVPAQSKPREQKELAVPAYFLSALKKNKKALLAFENFSYSHKKEYVDWITEAKREETRSKRIETALKWLAQGKGRNWKYEKC